MVVLLRLKPPQTEQAHRLYTTAAGLCSSATELKELRSHHPDLADAAESNVEQFPTAAGIAERERDAATRQKAVAVRELDRGTLRDILSSQVRPHDAPTALLIYADHLVCIARVPAPDLDSDVDTARMRIRVTK